MRLAYLTLLWIGLALGEALAGPARPVRAALEVVVTNAGDDVGEGASECPHESNCTLRRAIELVNADETGEEYTIAFDEGVFPEGQGTTISILDEPLPPISRADVTIDASGAEARIDGGSLADVADGIVVTGSHGVVRGLAVHNFGGVCITAAGENSVVRDTRTGACGTGIFAIGTGAVVRGNVVGFMPAGDEAAPVSVGVLANAADVRVGEPDFGPGGANIIGNAGTAVQVGEALVSGVEGVDVAGNIIGRTPGGGVAPVTTGIAVEPPAAGALISGNTIANATGNAIEIGADVGDATSTANRISANRFEAIGGLSVDLGANGVREPNDAGDEDAGPNTLLNHPVFTRAIQARIQGTACAGCRVELYLTSHMPGGVEFATSPLPAGVVTASEGGAFDLSAPAVTPGQWITALAIDGAGNTSEFAPGTRVGAGVAQCGSVGLAVGWNLVGFFGQGSLTLGNTFPPDGDASRVSAIYHLLDGSAAYEVWFADGAAGRTLNTLESAEAYWMYGLQPATLGGGFSLTVPLPVALKAGWNEFVYIGATADVRDALSSIAGKYTAVYRWSASTGGGRWLGYRTGLPAWAQGLTGIESCGAYSIFVTEDTLLTPLQP